MRTDVDKAQVAAQLKQLNRIKMMKGFETKLRNIRMPQFAMYSSLDKKLIHLFLLKATQISDDEIMFLRVRYFNPQSSE